MNYSTAIFLINDDVRAVRVVYDPGCKSNEHDVFKTFDSELAVDDLVVVESSTRHGMTIAKIADLDVDVDIDSNAQMRWIVQRVDVDPHNQLLKQEEAAMDAMKSAEKRQRRAEMRDKLFADQQDKLKALQLTKIEPDE